MSETAEFQQLSNIAKLFEMAHSKDERLIEFAPDALLDWAVAIRMVLAMKSRPFVDQAMLDRLTAALTDAPDMASVTVLAGDLRKVLGL